MGATLRALAFLAAAGLLLAQEQPERYLWLLPDGYHGWACVAFGVAGAAPLPREEGARLIRVRPGHDVETSDRTNSYLGGPVWYEAGTARRQAPEGVDLRRGIEDSNNGRHCFFIGTVDEADAAEHAPGFRTWHEDRPPLPAEERQALIDLYNATDGSHWNHHVGWLGPPGTECRLDGVGWHGVLCHVTNDRWSVVDLSLDRNHLAGTIPESIAQLTSLRNIELSENQLSGSVPEALARLKELEGLDLVENRLSGLLPDALIRRWENGSLNIVADVPQFTDISQIEFDWVGTGRLCARQRITLRADGGVVFFDERCRDATPDDRTTYCQKKEGPLHWSRFAKLARLIDKNGLYGLQPSYSRNITHAAFETTRVTRNGKIYAVENYADAAPLELWTIERAIEGVAFGVYWEKTTTQPACPEYVSPVPSQ